jgi:hypothetical protein
MHVKERVPPDENKKISVQNGKVFGSDLPVLLAQHPSILNRVHTHLFDPAAMRCYGKRDLKRDRSFFGSDENPKTSVQERCL